MENMKSFEEKERIRNLMEQNIRDLNQKKDKDKQAQEAEKQKFNRKIQEDNQFYS
jgi:hypothetical protein